MLPDEVRMIIGRLNDRGYDAYAVGGCVRDSLLGRKPDDWDLTTSARPEEVMEIFSGCCIPTGLQHGTVTVRQNHQSYEVTTFRTDGGYTDHRHPDQVSFTRSLEEDLKRRDFTIGAMAMDSTGRIIDLFGGQKDLRDGVIRCVGDADTRFDEDALRIMRALRFASVLGFRIAPETSDAIHLGKDKLKSIAAERIREEMNKFLCGPKVAEVLLEYPDVIAVFLPEILESVGVDQKNPHHCYDIWEHTVRSIEASPANTILRWTMLFHDLGKPRCFTLDEKGIGHFYGHGIISSEITRSETAKLKFDNWSRNRICLLVEWHDRDIPCTRKGLRRAMNLLGTEGTEQLIAVKRADNLAQAPEYRGTQKVLDKAMEILKELIEEDACFTISQLSVNGNDMLELGITGPDIGRTLNSLLELVLEETLQNRREELLAWAAENHGKKL